MIIGILVNFKTGVNIVNQTLCINKQFHSYFHFYSTPKNGTKPFCNSKQISVDCGLIPVYCRRLFWSFAQRVFYSVCPFYINMNNSVQSNLILYFHGIARDTYLCLFCVGICKLLKVKPTTIIYTESNFILSGTKNKQWVGQIIMNINCSFCHHHCQ